MTWREAIEKSPSKTAARRGTDPWNDYVVFFHNGRYTSMYNERKGTDREVIDSRAFDKFPDDWKPQEEVTVDYSNRRM